MLPVAITTSSNSRSSAALARDPEPELDIERRIERGPVVVEERSPAMAMRRGGGDRQVPADRRALVEQHDLPLARQRSRALEPRRSGADDRDASAAGAGTAPNHERRGRPAREARRRQLRVDRAQQDGIEGAAVLVARHAWADLRLASGQQLRGEVRIGDQRTRDADHVGAGRERALDLVAAAESLGDQQRALDQRADSVRSPPAEAAPRSPCP